MNRTQERNDDGAVPELDRLNESEKILGGLMINQEGIVEGVSGWDILAKVPS